MTRIHAGRLGFHAQPGTILGPKEVTREYVIVTGNDEHGLTVGYARTDDLDDEAITAMVDRGPRSLAEHTMVQRRQLTDRLRLRMLLGPLRDA